MTSAAVPPTDRPSRSALLVVFLVVAIDLLGFGIVLPLQPLFAQTYLADRDPLTKGVVIGVLFSVFSLMQFVFSPMWGRVSDRIGRRPILLLSLAGSVVFYALFGFASTLPAEQALLALSLLFVSRVGAGIAGASVSTAAAVIADCTAPENRAKGMALIGAAFGIGFTFGPLIAWAGEATFRGAPWGAGALASGLSLAALILAALIFRETLPPGPKPPREFFSLARTRAVLRMPTVGVLVLIYGLAIFSFANLEGTLALFATMVFAMSKTDNYLVFAYTGFVLMVAQGGLYRPLASRRSEELLLKLGLALMFLGFGGFVVVALAAHRMTGSPDAIAGLQPLFYLSLTVAVTGFAFLNPSVAALVSKRSDSTRQGEALGVNQSFAAIGRILGPLAGSLAFYQDESRILPYVVGLIALVLVTTLVPGVRGPNPSEGSCPTTSPS